jgi:hypothetical protein
MKRADLVVGQEYVLMSPSQNVDEYSLENYGQNKGQPSSRTKRVVVLDTAPKFRARSRSWGREDREQVAALWNGEAVLATDGVYELSDTDKDWDGEARRSVKVLRLYSSWSGPTYEVTAVPLSQVRMTFDEFMTQAQDARRRADERRKRQDEAEEARKAASLQLLDDAKELATLLPDGSGLAITRDAGRVHISGSLSDLREFLTQARCDADVLEHLAETRPELDVAGLQVVLAR